MKPKKSAIAPIATEAKKSTGAVNPDILAQKYEISDRDIFTQNKKQHLRDLESKARE